MPHIRSASPDSNLLETPSYDTGVSHGAESRRQFIPLAFQITSPFDYNKCLLPHALVMHVNPSSLSYSHNKKVDRFQTLGGYVEQHWGDDLSEISADGSTGAFMNIYTGLSSVLRQQTIAWDRYQDLYDLFEHNGSVYDPYGNIVLQGQVMLIYDRGTYLGYFTTFDVEETDDTPYSFNLSWVFKVQHIIFEIPRTNSPPVRVPDLQYQNQMNSNALSMEKQSEYADSYNSRLQQQAQAEQSKAQAEQSKAQEGAKIPSVPSKPKSAAGSTGGPAAKPVGGSIPVQSSTTKQGGTTTMSVPSGMVVSESTMSVPSGMLVKE